MGYLPDFEYDIFISYTHLDNYFPVREIRWVDQFHEWLESGLVRRFGHQKIKIWRDSSLHGNTIFDERIPKVVKSSALFLALNSQHYIKSEYCQKEVRWFCEAAKASPFGLSVHGEKRLFNVLLHNIHHSRWPEDLSGTESFPLYDVPKDSLEIGWPIDSEDRLFRKQIQKIVDAIEVTLNAFPQPVEVPQPKSATPRVQVFIANVDDSLKNFRERLVRDLVEINVQIADPIPPPRNNAAHTAHVSQAMQETNLAIHLLNNCSGEQIEDNKITTYPHQQVKIGLNHPTSQIVWVPKNLNLTSESDDTGTAFIHELENNPRTKKNFTFMRSDYTTFYRELQRFVDEIKRIPQTKKESQTILLDSHQKDQLFAFELANLLIHENLHIEFNQDSHDPNDALSKFEKLLELTQHCIIIFGQVNNKWVCRRVEIINKYLATHLEQARIESCWIFVVPPQKNMNEFPKFPRLLNINFLDNSNSISLEPDLFKPLLDCCHEGRFG